MKPVVILSPHLDDAVFSCWHLLDAHATVITVFAGVPHAGTKTLWDRLCGQADSVKMVTSRREENEAVFRGLGITSYALDYLDQQYHPPRRDIKKIANALLDTVATNATFVAPLAGSAVWRHPDHVVLREVGKYLTAQGKDVAFYADTPYMRIPNRQSSRYEERMARRSRRLTGEAMATEVVELTSEMQQAKRSAMQRYGTQYTMTNLVSLGALGRKAVTEREVIFRKVM